MVNRTRLFSLLATLCLLFFLAACGDDSAANNSGGNGEQCGDSSRDGTTSCQTAFDGNQCTAGQYCNTAEFHTTCSVGCLSDANCGGNQFCDLDGGSPGTCRNCSQFSGGGGSGDGGSGDGGSGDGGSGDGGEGDSGDGDGGGSTGGNSCPEVADHLIEYCSPFEESDRADIEDACTDVITSDERQCIVDGDTCAESIECIEHHLDDGGWDDGGNGGNGGNNDVTDFGDVCDFDSECDDVCAIEDQSASGYCSTNCTDDFDCPDGFWICDTVPSSTAKYCLQF